MLAVCTTAITVRMLFYMKNRSQNSFTPLVLFLMNVPPFRETTTTTNTQLFYTNQANETLGYMKNTCEIQERRIGTFSSSCCVWKYYCCF